MIQEYSEYLIFLFIIIFTGRMILTTNDRSALFSRKPFDWTIEILSLLNHFVIIPLAQASIVLFLLESLLGEYKNILNSSFAVSLLLYMLLDYGWYWNHRLLHSRNKLWNFHMIHHSAKHLDTLSTARNSLVSPLLMVYFWIAPFFIFILKDAHWFLLFSTLGLLVNFWGHTRFNFKRKGKVQRMLSFFLITPFEHFWHHSTENSYCNFGTVFNFWDRLHGTWYSPEHPPKELGFEVKMSKIKQLIFPW